MSTQTIHDNTLKELVYNNVILKVKSPEDIEIVATHLTTLAKDSIQEPGCRRFEVYHSETEAAVFILIEEWQSQQALDQHRQAPAFQTVYLPNVIPLVERTPHRCRRLL